jgi:hypothetical protein
MYKTMYFPHDPAFLTPSPCAYDSYPHSCAGLLYVGNRGCACVQLRRPDASLSRRLA